MIRALWDNLDYACFTGTLLLGFSLKHLIFRAHWKKELFLADCLFFLLCIGCGWLMLQTATKSERSRLERTLEGLAPAYARETERLNHEQVGLHTAPDDPTYLALIEAQIRWQETNPGVADIYTLRKLPNGETAIIVDSESDGDGRQEGPREKRTPIGEIYTAPNKGVELAFRGEPHLDPIPTTDRWGNWVAAWHPLRGADGRVDAVVGIDYDATEWIRAIGLTRFRVVASLAVVATLFGAFTGIMALRQSYRLRQARARLVLRQSEERLALHLAQTPLAAIEWDLRFRVVQWNRSAERIFGFSASEAIGRSGFDLIVPESRRSLTQQSWDELLEGGVSRTALHEAVTKSGRPIVCEFFCTPVADPKGEIVGVASLCQDITERKNLEEELRQSQKLQSIGNFAALIAHDFNNILSVIQGHSDMVLATPDVPRAAFRSAHEINRTVRRGADLTRQLLTFSRKQKMRTEQLDLNALVGRVAQSIQPMIGPAIDLRLNLAEPIRPVVGDSVMLEQALVNLAINARDAMPSGGELEFATSAVSVEGDHAATHAEARPGDFVRVTVRDSGTGIAPEHLARVFEPFFTTKPAGQGTGLGLAAVYGTLKQHHGWIEIASEPGRGSRFELFLPACPDASPADPETFT